MVLASSWRMALMAVMYSRERPVEHSMVPACLVSRLILTAHHVTLRHEGCDRLQVAPTTSHAPSALLRLTNMHARTLELASFGNYGRNPRWPGGKSRRKPVEKRGKRSQDNGCMVASGRLGNVLGSREPGAKEASSRRGWLRASFAADRSLDEDTGVGRSPTARDPPEHPDASRAPGDVNP